jgi:hypothetical protein
VSGTGRRRVPFRQSRDAERLRLVKGLRSVSRRGATTGRARRYEVLLCGRADAVRSDLLEVAATLERVPNPDPSTLTTLRWRLTDGCTSPLFHPDVPMDNLVAVLEMVQAELDGLDPCKDTLKCQIANRPSPFPDTLPTHGPLSTTRYGGGSSTRTDPPGDTTTHPRRLVSGYARPHGTTSATSSPGTRWGASTAPEQARADVRSHQRVLDVETQRDP